MSISFISHCQSFKQFYYLYYITKFSYHGEKAITSQEPWILVLALPLQKYIYYLGYHIPYIFIYKMRKLNRKYLKVHYNYIFLLKDPFSFSTLKSIHILQLLRFLTCIILIFNEKYKQLDK